MANGDGEAKKQRAPHPATVQRKSAQQPEKGSSKPPHPATVQRKTAAPGGARKEREPHPATVQKKSGGTSASRSTAASFGKDGTFNLASGSALYHGTSYAGVNVILRSGIGATVNGRAGSAFTTSTSLEAGRASLAGSGAVLELRTTRALQGGNETPAAGKTKAAAEPAAESTPPDFAVDRKGSRAMQCKMFPRALDALSPVAVYLRDARGAWARFTVTQYREMADAG